MASSGYTPITFVAGETPSTMKWNYLGSNDASFNTGSGFNDGVLIARHFDNSTSPVQRSVEQFPGNFFESGMLWTAGSGLAATMTAGIYYAGGTRVNYTSTQSNTFGASMDTYIDFDGAGLIYYTPVTNGFTAPGLLSGRVRNAVVVTNGTTITAINQIMNVYNGGFMGFDNGSNRVYPTSPNNRILGQTFYNGSAGISVGTTTGAISGWPMSNVSFFADGRTQVEVELYIPDVYYSSGYFFEFYLWDTTLNNAIGGQAQTAPSSGVANTDWMRWAKGAYTPSAGVHTITVYGRSGSGTQSATFSAGRVGWNPAFIIVRRSD